MKDSRVDGKTVLVSGASGGIGGACALSLARAGARIIATGRNYERLAKVVGELPATADHQVFVADLTASSQIDLLVNFVPSIHGVVYAAGAVRPQPIKYIQQNHIEELFGINYNGAVLLTSALLRKKKISKGAAFVFISSISSQFAHKGGALYAGSKAALNQFSKTLAIECASQGIRSNVISAAMVKTAIFEQAQRSITKEGMDRHGEAYPLGFGAPEDVAEACVFLLSNAAKWITGTELVMDGGLTAGQ